MNAIKKLRNETIDRACLACRKRKTRCIIPANNEICTYCFKKGKECIFDERPHRTPLTRRNLDAAESRCEELELLLQHQSDHRSPGQNFEAASNSTQDLLSPSRAASGTQDGQAEIETPGDGDVSTNRSNEWQEWSNLENPTNQDGMAINSTDSGYLGKYSIPTH